ncbi:MAG TPA: hypothetical protein VME40_13480 [Caulobacteraceae bacterium]|nr:hypothetical protein [Caulobacteraceae bacterium]
MSSSVEHLEFSALRPRLLALLEMHRTAPTEAARAALTKLLEEVFLATTWLVAQDLLENGWRPGFVTPTPTRPRGGLRVVGGADTRPRASLAKRAAARP